MEQIKGFITTVGVNTALVVLALGLDYVSSLRCTDDFNILDLYQDDEQSQRQCPSRDKIEEWHHGVDPVTEPQAESNDVAKNRSMIFHFHKDGRHYVRCTHCYTCPEIVKLFTRNGKIPAMAQESGTIFEFHDSTVADHIQTTYHSEAGKALQLRSIPPVKAMLSSQIGKQVSKANEEMCNRIGCLMLQIYNDAKKLTLSAHVSYILSKCAKRIYCIWNLSKAGVPACAIVQLSDLFWSMRVLFGILDFLTNCLKILSVNEKAKWRATCVRSKENIVESRNMTTGFNK